MSEEEKSDAKADDTKQKRSRGSFILGWVMGPGLAVLGILTAGVYVGANHPGSFVTRGVEWLVALFPV